MNYWFRVAQLGVAFAGAVLSTAQAADRLRAGKAVATSFPMALLDLGAEESIFARYGIEVEITALTGDAKLQQAFAAGSIDIGLGSGPAMAFEIKGSPTIGVAAFAGAPRTISVTVLLDSPIKVPADLKGKLLAISTTGSLTEWLTKRLAVREGWGPDGVRMIALGAGAAMNGALFTKQIDAMMTGTENALILVDRGQARIVTGMETYAPDFLTHVVFASNDLVQKNPGLVARFLKGFFASMAFAKANKARVIEILSPLLNESPTVLDKVYEHELPMLIEDGTFDPKAVAVLKDSFVEMGILDQKPSDHQLFTTRFVPVKP
jgi:ABC-type nitrate/sulfonate/bicarbonate transport system substrate-binding protein